MRSNSESQSNSSYKFVKLHFVDIVWRTDFWTMTICLKYIVQVHDAVSVPVNCAHMVNKWRLIHVTYAYNIVRFTENYALVKYCLRHSVDTSCISHTKSNGTHPNVHSHSYTIHMCVLCVSVHGIRAHCTQPLLPKLRLRTIADNGSMRCTVLAAFTLRCQTITTGRIFWLICSCLSGFNSFT